jgi:hypothetical protein
MKPSIDSTQFGSIIIEGHKYTHDILIGLDGQVKKRKKKLSKEIYGTSHTISLAEAKYIFEEGSNELIIAAGQFGRVHLSPEAEEYFKQKKCLVRILQNRKAIKAWNEAEGSIIGLFHLTC